MLHVTFVAEVFSRDLIHESPQAQFQNKNKQVSLREAGAAVNIGERWPLTSLNHYL